MFKNILTIIRKECARFFRDRRMVFTVILLPGLLIYGIYSLMGTGMQNSSDIPDDYAVLCHVQNLPESFAEPMALMGFEVTPTDDVDQSKQALAEDQIDLVVVFPADFDEKIEQGVTGEDVPNVQVYHNSDNPFSGMANSIFTEQLHLFEDSFFNILDINKGVMQPDFARGTLIIGMLPMLVILFLFTGCTQIAPESIAGEKERGTIATLLVTPVSRTAIAIGKITSMSIFAILSGLSSFTGLALSLPNMFGDAMNIIKLDMFGAAEYLCFLAVILSTVILAISLFAVISAYSKSVKEATSKSTFIMITASICGMAPMLALDLGSISSYIPLLNSAMRLYDIFLLDYSLTNILITCGSNLVITIALAWVLSIMFNSERIMFNK